MTQALKPGAEIQQVLLDTVGPLQERIPILLGAGQIGSGQVQLGVGLLQLLVPFRKLVTEGEKVLLDAIGMLQEDIAIA